MREIIFSFLTRECEKFSRNGKASFSRLLFIFYFFFFLISQTKPYLFQQSSPAVPPSVQPHRGRALGTFSPGSAQSQCVLPIPAGLWPNPALLPPQLFPPACFFGFSLSSPASSSAPKPGCIHGSSQKSHILSIPSTHFSWDSQGFLAALPIDLCFSWTE